MIACDWAKPSFSVLSTRLTPPWLQRVTDLLRCVPVWRKPSAAQQSCELGGRVLVERELDELDAEHSCARRQMRRGLVGERDQRAHAVRGEPARRAGAELVVEDLERERAGIARRLDRPDEIGDGEIALSGKAAEMPAPAQHVHVELRRVGELDEEDAVAGDRRDRSERRAPRQRVERVEDQPDALDGRPGARSPRRRGSR